MAEPQFAFDPYLLEEQLRCEVSLMGYIRYMWDVLEPGREFKSGWSIDAVCEHLEAVTNGHIKRLLINVPPGCMKSLTTEVFWPSWEWGPRNLPNMRYVSGSYSEALTVRDNRKARILMQSEKYQQLWGDRFHLLGDQNAKQKFENNHTGFKIATSVTGLGTGERGDRFIIDDPHNVKDGESEAKREGTLQWFTEVVPSRINDPDHSAIIIIMQRVHERDVSGLILAEELNYEHLMLPMEFEVQRKCFVIVPPRYMEAEQEEVIFDTEEKAWRKEDHVRAAREHEGLSLQAIDLEISTAKRELRYAADPREEDGELLWPERFSEHHLEEELKPQMSAWGGAYAVAGQLQQRPVPRGGSMFQRKDFQFISPLELNDLTGRKVRAYDLAASDGSGSAYTVGIKGFIDQHERVIIVDVDRYRMLPGGVRARIRSVAEDDGYDTQIDLPQDPGQSGKAQKADLAKALHGYDARFSPESGDKVLRAGPLSAQVEAGNVYLVEGTWNQDFINEAIKFPRGQYKDQIDAASRMYSNLLRYTNTDDLGLPKVL